MIIVKAPYDKPITQGLMPKSDYNPLHIVHIV